ncbi:MAG: alpha/beta hydrolase [Bacteroidota bacterium]
MFRKILRVLFYVFAALLLLLILLFRLEMFTMRTEDRAFIEDLESHGQSLIRIQDQAVGERNIHTISVGDPSLPTIFFVHGSPGSSNNFQVYLADTSLSQKAHLVAADRPGFGYSDYGKTERSVEQQAALLAEVLKTSTQEPAILVGHSYGGPVIARMAMDHPSLVKALVIVAGSISPDLEPREWWRPVVDFPLIRWILPASLRVSNQEIHALYDELERMMPLWKTIQCPVIVFQGESDSLVPAGNADFAALMVPDSLVTIKMVELGDHFIVWSRKDEVVKILETQLAQ